MSLSLGTAWNETAALARRRWLFVFPVAFLLLSLPAAILQLLAPVTAPGHLPEPGWWLLLVPAPFATSLIGALAISRSALTGGESVGTTLAASLKRFFPLFGAALLIGTGAGALTLAAALLAPAFPTPILWLPLLLALSVMLVFFWARLLLLTSTASVESAGPIRLIRRAWALGGGHASTLISVLIVVSIASLLALLVAGAVGGIIARLGPDLPQPDALAMLLVLIVSAMMQAVIGGLFTVFLARLYAQLAVENPVGD